MNKKTFKQMIAFAFSAALVCGAFSGCGVIPKEDEQLPPPLIKANKAEIQTAVAQKKDINKTLTGNGTFMSVKECSIFVKDSGQRLKFINVKSGQAVHKGDVVAEIDIGDLNNTLQLEQFNLKKAQIILERDKNTLANQNGTVAEGGQQSSSSLKYQIELDQNDVDMEKTKVSQLSDAVSKAKLVSPIDGIVSFIENYKQGDSLEPYKTILKISDPNNLQLYFQGQDCSKAKKGMKAEVNYNGNELSGTVVMSPEDTNSDTSDTFKNAILINIDHLPSGINVGDSASFSIIIQSSKNTIVIPNNAVRTYLTENSVQVLKGESKQDRNIKIGIQTPTETEVISGLQEGEKVILK